MRRFIILLAFLMIVMGAITEAHCQTTAPLQSKYVLATGGGMDPYSVPRDTFMWGALGIRLAQNVYNYSTLIMTREKTTTLTGIAAQIHSEEWVRLYAFGQAGAETGEGVIQGAYSAGGFGVVPIGKLFGAPQFGVMSGVKIETPVGAVDRSVVKPTFFLGITWSSKPE